MNPHRASVYKKLADTVKRKLDINTPPFLSSKKVILDDVRRIINELIDSSLEQITTLEKSDDTDSGDYSNLTSRVFWTKVNETPFFLEYLGYHLIELRYSPSENNKACKQQESRVQKLLKQSGYNVKVVFKDFPFLDSVYKEELESALDECNDSIGFGSELNEYELINQDWENSIDEFPMSEEQYALIRSAPNGASVWEISWYKPKKNIQPIEKFKNIVYPAFWDSDFFNFITSDVGSDFIVKLFNAIKLAACASKYFVLADVVVSQSISTEITVNLAGEEFYIDANLEMILTFLQDLGYIVNISEQFDRIQSGAICSCMKISWASK